MQDDESYIASPKVYPKKMYFSGKSGSELKWAGMAAGNELNYKRKKYFKNGYLYVEEIMWNKRKGLPMRGIIVANGSRR